MVTRKPIDKSRLDATVAAAHRAREQRELGYREQALKLYPWVCGRCGRSFTRQNLRELTVHHRDHDHDNNPADGSNWELLCLYCHDDEHSRQQARGRADSTSQPTEGFRPFADLAKKLRES